MVAELMALCVLVVLGILGGIMHAIVPPQETKPMEIVIRVGAGIIVAVFYTSVSLVTPLNVVTILMIGPGVMTTAYFALDLLKTRFPKPPPG